MIELPSLPAPTDAEPALVDFGGFIIPPLGGRVQRVDRLGSRFRISVTMPPMPSKDIGRVFVRRLTSGKLEGVRMEYPLIDFDPGLPGNPVVDGNGQSGRVLKVRGLTPGYVIREGQFFSHIHPLGRCLYLVDADVIVGANGKATVPITPLLRVEPIDGQVLEFLVPKIEGFIQGDEFAWSLALDHNVRIQFVLEEFE